MGWIADTEIYWSRVKPGSATVVSSDARAIRPIVVLFGWMNCERRHVAAYLRLYNGCGWDVLVCCPPVLNLWIPRRAQQLANKILGELNQEVAEHPRPVVLAPFSGGAKACHYRLLQDILSPVPCNKAVENIRKSLAGHIFDSCPIDFISSLGVKFLSDPPGHSGQPSWFRLAAASVAAQVLDSLFPTNLETQRREFWRSLKNVGKAGPVLLLFCKNDVLAPHERITQFAKELRADGVHVTAVCWEVSEHVGHLRRHPEYASIVRQFLVAAIDQWQIAASSSSGKGLLSDRWAGTEDPPSCSIKLGDTKGDLAPDASNGLQQRKASIGLEEGHHMMSRL